MPNQLPLDLDEIIKLPDDDQEVKAVTPGDVAQDLDDEYSSFEDLHFRRTERGG